MKQDTKQAIIEAAAPLIYGQGFHRTGLKEILDAAGVPKGSFYFYFKSKEDFGLALVEHYMRFMAGFAAPLMGDSSMPPLARLKRFFTVLAERQREAGFTRGCPIGNMAQEMSDLSPPLRERLNQALDAFSGAIGAVLAEAAGRGELPPGLNPATAAAFVVDAWEGALLRMKAEKSGEPLERFLAIVFGRLLS